MEWHNILLIVLFISYYNMFYVPAANIRKEFNKAQKVFTNPRIGLNNNEIEKISVGNLPRLPTNLKGIPNNVCLGKGLYLGPEQRFQNCELLCNTKGAIYKFLHEDNVIVYKNSKLQPGSWCLPAAYNRCNLSTSQIIWNRGDTTATTASADNDNEDDDWDCLPKSNLFGGPGNNQILGCNGVLYNTRTQKTYKDYIPPTLEIGDINEKWIDANGTERYVLECGKSVDDRANPLIQNNLGNRFQLQRNYCAKYLYNSILAKTNFEKGTCECEGGLTNIYNIPQLPCSSCLHGANKFTTASGASKDAFAIAVPCLEKTTRFDDIDTEHHFILCGTRKFSGQSIACMTVNVLIAQATNEEQLQISSIPNDHPVINRLLDEGKITKDDLLSPL